MSTDAESSSRPVDSAGTSGLPTQSFFEDPLPIRDMLVAIDFSDESFRALEYALPLAKRFDASVHVIYVYDGEHQFSSTPMTPELFDDIEVARHLRQELQRRFAMGVRPKQCHVRSGRPFQEICMSAKDIKADLVVVATRGRSGFEHLTLGSTAEKVVRHAACPILVVRRGASGPIRTDANGIVLQKILVPVDFSECAKEGAKYASAFATRVGTDVRLIHIVHPADYMAAAGFAEGLEWPPIIESARLNAEDRLDELVNFLPLVGIDAETEVEIGQPVEKLAEATKRSDIDMVIMSTHGYTGLRHALIGSTAEQLVRRAHCPVLVVPSHCRQVPA